MDTAPNMQTETHTPDKRTVWRASESGMVCPSFRCSLSTEHNGRFGPPGVIHHGH